MFDDIKDTFAKISIARLQKRIDALKSHQEMLDKVTQQRTLSELEHYRLQLSIGVAAIVLFGVMCLVGTSVAVTAMMAHHTSTAMERLLTGLVLLRGPAGEIDAAVNNARDVAEQVARTTAKTAVIYPFEEKVKHLRAEFEKLKLEFEETKGNIQTVVDNQLVQTLRDYGVLDENMNPVNKAHLNTHLKQLGILKA